MTDELLEKITRLKTAFSDGHFQWFRNSPPPSPQNAAINAICNGLDEVCDILEQLVGSEKPVIVAGGTGNAVREPDYSEAHRLIMEYMWRWRIDDCEKEWIAMAAYYDSHKEKT
jgi:hypothetical protein